MEKEFYQLYNLFLNQKEINFDDIINQGYNEEQIEKLLHKEKLKLRKNNQYLLLDDSGLYEYATYLIKNRNFEDAKKAFNMILIINPDHVEAKFNLSLYLVDNKQYQEAINF